MILNKYTGLDVHKENFHATVMGDDGEILRRQRFPNSLEEVKSFFSDIGDGKVALEASYFWEPVYDELEEMGFDVKLAHPGKTRVIADEKIKTDLRASEALAQLLRMGWLPEAYVPPVDIRELRELLRRRVSLVESRTKYKNKIQAELTKRRIELDGTPWYGPWTSQLEELEIDPVEDYMVIIRSLNDRIDKVEKQIKERAEETEEAMLIESITGFSYFSAMTVYASIVDIGRFPRPKELSSYFGVVPSTEQSGGKKKHGPITKEGDSYVRRVLIQCAWSHINNSDSYITEFFDRLKRRKGKPVAIVAAARKLTVAIYWMLEREEKFRPGG
ncbi:hypothetical protein AKJ51_03555 [candidate division MSBL1 archaeon SCGC-AAA382A20]|uniref:Uncharacterized protein n=1 Tax=candidate division MSBL1 archaeon SCGC-AAA382A20 TaxID=1698280 RepID=A0A133VJD8_9EURY|nr:hypothetical protein AKJ51_03555 [candidate division MSBL1 archaeon SCGC-AAA382A20]